MMGTTTGTLGRALTAYEVFLWQLLLLSTLLLV